MKLSKDATSVLVATFSPWKNEKRLPINGNVEPLRDFFVPKVFRFTLIDQIYPGSDEIMPRIEVYEGKTQYLYRSSWWLYLLYPFLRVINTTNPGKTHISYKLRDFFSVVDWGLREGKPADLFIGLESINGLAGIVLRGLGKVRKVIYYVSDYSPRRYENRWFNALYLWLDRFCARHADYIWDVSSAMQPARISVGLDQKKSAPVLVVPNALYPKQISQAPKNEVQPYSMVFMGTLGIINGPDIAIEAVPFVRQKYPGAMLHIVGGNATDLKRLYVLVKRLKLGENVQFYGFIDDREKISSIIRRFSVALAPYPHIPWSARLYGDATKIRAYTAAGLPVVTTDVPPLGKEVAKAGGALIVGDDPKAIAAGVVRIFSEPTLYESMRRKALLFAKHNTWENEFTKAFRLML